VRFVQARFAADLASAEDGRPGIQIRVRTTASSFETFRELSGELPEGRALFQTVDAWCRPEELRRFLAAADETPPETTVLAVTTLREGDDERPLWTRCASGAGGGTVLEIGGPSGDCATAGLYVFSPGARELARRSRADRLRTFLAELSAAGEPLHAVPVAGVVDVDRGSDVQSAEALAGRPRMPGAIPA
jgi:hypothetical protein